MTRRSLVLALVFLLSTLACRAPDPNAALHRAAFSGPLSKVQEMVKQGADINKVVDGETPLMRAAQGTNAETMTFLMAKGADLTVKDAKGRDLWQILRPYEDRPLRGRQARCLAVLVDHGFQDRMTLMEAAKYGDSAVLIKRLVDHGADVHTVDEYGWTPLHWAAFEGSSDACVGLLNAGAEVNVESTAQYSKSDGSVEDSGEHYRYRFEKGSRPLDVASSSISRNEKSCTVVLKDFGGTKNPTVKNLHRNY